MFNFVVVTLLILANPCFTLAYIFQCFFTWTGANVVLEIPTTNVVSMGDFFHKTLVYSCCYRRWFWVTVSSQFWKGIPQHNCFTCDKLNMHGLKTMWEIWLSNLLDSVYCIANSTVLVIFIFTPSYHPAFSIIASTGQYIQHANGLMTPASSGNTLYLPTTHSEWRRMIRLDILSCLSHT